MFEFELQPEHGEYPDCRSERESGGGVLWCLRGCGGDRYRSGPLLSCVTIIVGSLRKDSRLRNPHLQASYGPDVSPTEAQWEN
ncbi:hypothetical protein INR49_011542 [Caranx melampygus]|nr:hypothetical protein INR49_011542 [Caranx melampygus]